MKTRSHLSSTRHQQRGSVLIVAALFAAIIAVALGSYMVLSSTSLKLANRSFYSNAALNLAETGIEEAMWSFNQVHGGAALGTAWAGWTVTPTSGADGIATRTFPNFPLAGNTTGAVKVYVDHYNPSGLTQPKVLARATISIPNSSPIVKELEVTLSKRSYFAMGMVAEDTITFAGNNAVVDSWNSQFNDDGTPRGSPVGYNAPFPVGDHRNYDRPRVGGANANGNGSIGAKAVGVGITVQNADIYGTASTSGSNPAASINTGPNGTIQAPPPAPRPPNGEDPARISGGFNPQLEMPTVPTVSGAPLTSFGSTLGTAGSTQVFRSTVGITSSLTVHGHVTLVIDVPPGSNAINLTGNSFLKISAGSSLVIYSPGDVKAAGNAGLNNENTQPITFQFYGTSTSSPAQDIKVAGNGAFKGTIYAPKATIDLKGNGQYQGSIVGYSITVGGGAIFHYDEALADAGGNNSYGLSAWRELVTAAERAVYATELSF